MGFQYQELDSPQRRPGISQRWAGHDLVLYDSASGRLHLLNSTAAVVWTMCDGATTVEAIGRDLEGTHQLDPGTDVAADVRAILSSFSNENLLEAAASLGGPPTAA